MITLTTEQAQQIEEIVEHLLVEHPTARHHKACVEALSIIRSARAQEQAEQEPVAWMHGIDCDSDDRDSFMVYYKQTPGYCMPLYAAPVQQAEQKPIGYVIEDNDYEGSKIWAEPINGCCLPVYLAPIHTKDLTDDEITALIREGAAGGGWQGFAQRVIAADRELNRA